jgi:hypothetical protein
MFWKKDEEQEKDQYAALKVALKIALRRIAGEEIKKTKEGEILALVCQGLTAATGDQYDDVVANVMDQYTDAFKNDPMLKQDITDILQLMGLGDKDVDIPKVDAVMGTVCSLVS